MKRRGLVVLVLLVLLVGLFYVSKGRQSWYVVTEVYDGDTVGVNMAGRLEKIRLIGIDTPETHDPRKPVQCYGPEAALFTATLKHQKIRLVADPLSTNRDRYGRLLRYVYLQDGTFYNEQLILLGYARSYRGFPFEFSTAFASSELAAKQSLAGLWGKCATAEADGA